MSEVYLLNPGKYPRVLSGLGRANFLWERSYLERYHIDHSLFATSQLRGLRYSYIVLERFGAVEYQSTVSGHTAVYPIWSYKRSFSELEEMVNAGPANKGNLQLIPQDRRPRLNQPHRIFITDVPDASTGVAKAFYLDLKDIQKENPDVQFVIHRISSFRIAFALGFFGAVLDPFAISDAGSILVPSGSKIENRNIFKFPKWCKLFGYTVHELKASPEKRLQYNIASLDYARNNFTKLVALKDGVKVVEDTNTPVAEMTYPELRSARPLVAAKDTVQPGDKVTCDTCSLAPKCSYARQGAVCGLPGTEGRSLGDLLRTRDSESIVIALSGIAGKNADRLERLLDEEEAFGEYDPAATRLSNQVFSQAEKLAKLIDPNLRGAKVNVNVGTTGPTAVSVESGQDPKQVMAGLIKSLEARGYKRSEITPELINKFLQISPQIEAQPEIIEAEVVSEVSSEDPF